MIATPFAAHGLVAFDVTLEPGTSHTIDINSPTGIYENGYYYFVSGECQSVDNINGSLLTTRSAGWLSLDNPNSGLSHQGSITVSTEFGCKWICIPRTHNSALPPSLTPFTISSPTEFPNGSNLLLAGGTVTIGTTVFTGPAQIRVRTGPAILIPGSVAYILKF